jgi:alanyl-tRNA synthetase
LIKKASVISSSIGIRKKDLISASEKIIEINSLYYINIGLEQKTILDKISKEIEKSLLLVDRSLNFLEKVDLGKIDYGDIFHFYDTMGIPLEIIKCSLKKKDIEFDEDKFKDYLEKQRTRSKEERKSKKIRKFQF